MTIDFDGITGNHVLIIDTSDNTVAGFYVTGKEYQVRIEGATVDAGAINAFVGAFSIERAGGALALSVAPASLFLPRIVSNFARISLSVGTSYFGNLKNSLE